MWQRRIRRRLGRIAPITVGVLGVIVPVHHAASQALIDPCADLPSLVVEDVLARLGTRVTVSESFPQAFETAGTCSYHFAGSSLRLTLIAQASGSAAELAELFDATPRPPGAVPLTGIGDEAFRHASSGATGVMFRSGRIMGTIEFRGAAPGLDAAAVEFGRRWVARLTGAPRPAVVVAQSDAAPPVAVAATAGRRAPAHDTDTMAGSQAAEPDVLPTCAGGVEGICVPDEPTLMALSLVEAIENDEPDQIRPTIRDAVLAAGFSILEEDGSATPPTTAPAQGIAVHAWELEGVARLVERGATFPLDTVAASVGALFGLSDGGAIAALLLEGIRAHAASERESLRTWARLIAALGQQHQGIDLLGPVATTRVELDALQMLLILRRLAADLAAAGGAPASRHGALAPAASFHLAAASNAGGSRPLARFAAFRSVRAVRAGCAPSDIESYIQDWASIALTTGFGGFMAYPGLIGYLEQGLSGKAASAVGKYGAALGAANHLLSFIKLALTYSSIEAELELDGSGPLLRTHDRKPGEQRTVRATLKMDIDDLQWFNCARLALNHVGLDFSVPNGGPLSGVETWWRLEEGGVEIEATDVDYGIVQFGAGQLIQRRYTDGDGRASVIIEGKPQRYELSPTRREENKQATVRLEVKIKAANLIKDLPDIAGAALAGPGAPIAAAMEMYYRSRVPVKALQFPVRDWTDRVRFRISRVDDLGAGFHCNDEATDFGRYTESYEVTVDHDGARVVARRNVRACDQIVSTAEGADHARCSLTGSFEGRLRMDALHPQTGVAHYMLNGRPTRKGVKVAFEPYAGARASVSGSCADEVHDNWRHQLTSGIALWFPHIPDGATSVRSIDADEGRDFLLEILEGDISTFRVR